MQMVLWEQEFAGIHRWMLVVASVGGGLWGDELEEESSVSSLPGEVGRLAATWGDLASDVANRGNAGVVLGGVGAVGDLGMVEGIEGLVGDNSDDCRLGGNSDLAASAEATGPEVAEELVQGLGRLQSAWAIWRWWFSVVKAREAREARKVKVLIAGVGKLVDGMWRWRLSGIVLQWRHARQA